MTVATARDLGKVSIFGGLRKVAPQSDGTLMVEGIASTGIRDDAGEIVLPAAMKAAIPAYLKFPAIREMHTSIAAGRAVDVGFDAASGETTVVAHVVDPVTVKKVQAGVLAGFSIGGKVLKRDLKDPSIITEIRLVEISLVDRPCNPDAVITLWKTDRPIGRDALLKSDRLGGRDAAEAAFDVVQEIMNRLFKVFDLEPLAKGASSAELELRFEELDVAADAKFAGYREYLERELAGLPSRPPYGQDAHRWAALQNLWRMSEERLH